MDFDDFDDLDGPKKEVPSRISKFEPKSFKTKPQPRGKSQSGPSISRPGLRNSTSKSEAEESVLPAKSEPQNAPGLAKNEDEEDTKPKIDGVGKTEPVALSNGADKMEIDDKTEVEEVRDDPMEDGEGVEEEREEEEEDMIVREIDVYFNPSIDPDSQLYVMQYPLRPSWRPYELDERCEEVRVRPQSKEVELDLSIDDSANWDHVQASKFNMTKQTLTSSFMSSHASGYAVGVLAGNKLYLNPIDAVVQLRPSLAHVESIDSKRKNCSTSNAGATVKLEDSNEAKPGSSKKQVKRTELENDPISEAEESWIPLKYNGTKSEISSTYLQKMMTKESSKLEFTMNPYDYMNSLCPTEHSGNTNSKRLSKRVLLSLTLEERVKTLFLEGPPIQRFRFLKHFAPDSTSEDLLAILNKLGRLVQGHWVPNSTLLFRDAKDILKIAARDNILLLFSKSLTIGSSELNIPVKLKEDTKSFLNIFGVERPSFKDWKFKEQRDSEFLKLHPEIERDQREGWEKIDASLKSYFQKIGKSMNTMSKQIATRKPVKQSISEKSTPKTTSENSVTIGSTITIETREALLKALPKVFQNHKVCSFELICQGLRDLAVSQSALPKSDPKILKAAASGADAPPDELKEIIGQVAYNIHGSYVLKSSPDHPQYDDLRKAVIDLFLARGSDGKVKKAEVYGAAGRTITNSEYLKVMTDLCESKGGSWVLKRGDGKPS